MRVVQGVSIHLRPLCICGMRRGLHRYGDEARPNPAWRVGNGQPQWREEYGFVQDPRLPTRAMSREAVSP